MLIHVYVHVCVASPMVVGAWSMAGALWQLFEYYYSTAGPVEEDYSIVVVVLRTASIYELILCIIEGG